MHTITTWWHQYWGDIVTWMVIAVFAYMILYMVLWRLVVNLVKFLCKLYLRFAGVRKTGTILSSRGTGNSVNGMPVLRLQIQVVDDRGQPHTHTFHKLCDLGGLPSVGDSIEVFASKSYPGFFLPV